jgi:ABC-2 type transport system permease protein
MRLYWELCKLAFRRQMTYRAATLAGLATNFFFGLLRVAVIIALYGARQEVAGLSLPAAITYTGLSQSVIAYLSLFNWYEVINSVYSGDISSDMLKPMGYFTFWLAQDLGRAAAGLLVRGLTIMAAYALVFDITLPASWQQWLALGLALPLSWLVSFSWRFLVNLAAFWTPNAAGAGRMAFTLAWFLSGFMMPLRFLPDWAIGLCNLTPFPSMVNTVVEIYLNVLSGPALFRALLGQVLWIITLIGLAQLALRAGVRRLVIQGG